MRETQTFEKERLLAMVFNLFRNPHEKVVYTLMRKFCSVG